MKIKFSYDNYLNGFWIYVQHQVFSSKEQEFINDGCIYLLNGEDEIYVNTGVNTAYRRRIENSIENKLQKIGFSLESVSLQI